MDGAFLLAIHLADIKKIGILKDLLTHYKENDYTPTG
jgi:hypothetical protein